MKGCSLFFFRAILKPKRCGPSTSYAFEEYGNRMDQQEGFFFTPSWSIKSRTTGWLYFGDLLEPRKAQGSNEAGKDDFRYFEKRILNNFKPCI